MRHSTRFFSLVFMLLPAILLAADAPAVKINQLHINRKVSDDLNATLFDSEGLHLAIVITIPSGEIIGLDEDASKLISATDDKGTDLTEGSSDKWVSAFFSKISRNAQKISIPVHLGTIPAEGATSINLKGEMAINCGSDVTTTVIKPFDVTKTVTETIGENTIEVKPGGEPMAFGEKNEDQTISVTLNQNGNWLKSIEVLDAKGKVMKSESAGSSSSGGFKAMYINIKKDAKTIGLKLTHYKKIEQIIKSIDLKIGLGLK